MTLFTAKTTHPRITAHYAAIAAAKRTADLAAAEAALPTRRTRQPFHASDYGLTFGAGSSLLDDPRNDGAHCVCRGIRGDCDRCLACLKG